MSRLDLLWPKWKWIFLRSDTHAVKIILSFSSILWAVLLLWPGDTFSRPTYSFMKLVLGENQWGILFLIHGIWTLFNIAAFLPDTRLTWVNNFIGAVIWSGSSLLMIFAVTPPPAAISGEIVLSFMGAIWILIRTEVKNG